MNGIVKFRLCELSDTELADKVEKLSDELFTGDADKVLTRRIPARPNDDFDLLIGELLVRFREKSKA